MKASPEEIERHRAAERLKGERDAADRLATAREQGILIGHVLVLQQLMGQPGKSLDELRRLPEPELVQLEETLMREWSKNHEP